MAGKKKESSANGVLSATIQELMLKAQRSADEGRIAIAEKIYREILSLDPRLADALSNLGDLLFRTRRFAEAEQCFRQAIALAPDFPDAHNNLGAVLKQTGRLEEAVTSFETVTRLTPDQAGGYKNLGRVLSSLDRKQEAIAAFQNALRIHPDCAETLNDLGVVYERCLLYKEAKTCLEKSLKCSPGYHLALNNLAKIAQEQGFIEEAVAWYRKALKAKPDYALAHSNMLFVMHYLCELDPDILHSEHMAWGAQHAPDALARSDHRNDPNCDRPLRVGYLSPDIRTHSVAYFLEAILDAHDRSRIEPFAYVQVVRPDTVTERMAPKFKAYRATVGRSDDEVAEMIRADGIDILVDLAGHSAGNRATVLARKPAPVQVTYLGYPDTTGMRSVDYRFTDALADPEDEDRFYSEQLVRLPDCFLCYRPPDDAPPVGPLPFRRRGQVTFGSFNSLYKVNEKLVEIWSTLLHRVPGSRLLLKSMALQDKAIRDRYYELFRKHNLDGDRILLVSWEPERANHLSLYGEIDIGLDTYPYHGTTTTCEAFWMGVPVVTLKGRVHASRVGCSLLHQVGLDELVATTAEDYVKIAAELAGDADRMAKLRSELRLRMANGPLCDRAGFVQQLEQAFFSMWSVWGDQRGTSGSAGQDKEYKMPKITINRTPRSDLGASPSPPPAETPQPVRQAAPNVSAAGLSRVAELAVMADALNRYGQRAKALLYAFEGLTNLKMGRFAEGVPTTLLQSWQSPSLEGVFLRQCTAFSSFSSYFNRDQAKQWLMSWAKLEPDHPEPFLRLGLLLALDAVQSKSPMPPAVIQTLKHAASLMQDERSAKALALCSGGLSELSVPYDGGHIHVYPDICNISTYVLLEQGDWFEEDLDFFRSLVKPGTRVLDLGANIGVYSHSAASRVGADGCVVSVEPCRGTYELLARSAADFPRWTVRHAAVSEHSGEGCLAPGNAPELNKLSSSEGGGEKVKLVSVDDLAKDIGVDGFDLIKMDVEGHEIPTLRGAQKTLGEGRPIIFYEIKESNIVHLELVQAFRELGYESFIYLPGQKALEPLDVERPLDPFVLNAIAAKPERIQELLEQAGG